MSDLNICQRLQAIMKDVSYVQKEDKKVNNQYKFVSHDAVTAKIRPALLEHGVIVIPSFFDISVDGNRTNCSMSLTFVNVDKPVDRIEIPCAGFGQGIDPQDKGAGKAMSYAYKYALLKVFALETGDDPEKDNIDYAPPKDDAAEKLNSDIGNIFELNKAAGADAFKAWWGAEDSKIDRAKLRTLDEGLYNKLNARYKTAVEMFIKQKENELHSVEMEAKYQ
jgi:hypothetical protein